MKLLTTYACDKGTCVLNGIGFDNGVGDGMYAVHYAEELPEGYKKVEGVFIDLRDTNLDIYRYDCDLETARKITVCSDKKDEPKLVKIPAEAVEVAFRDGNMCLVKYF